MKKICSLNLLHQIGSVLARKGITLFPHVGRLPLFAPRMHELLICMKLTDATEGKEYIVNSINTKDEELNAFLFSLGCYRHNFLLLSK